MPIDYGKYPSNWKREIVPKIRERSGDACEWCGVKNHAVGFRRDDGVFVDETNADDWRTLEHEIEALEGDLKYIKIVLTVAHLDHDLAHNDGMDKGGPALALKDANLVHLCQKCHNTHDAPMRAANRSKTIDARRGQGRLF